MSDAAPAVAGVAALAIDCADSPGLANWWSRLLGGSVEVGPERNATLRILQGLAIDFLRVPDQKTVKNRLHLDLCTSSLAAATQQALALGATRAGDVYDGGRWQVLRHPKGNEFCLLRPNSDPREEGPRLRDLVVATLVASPARRSRRCGPSTSRSHLGAARIPGRPARVGRHPGGRPGRHRPEAGRRQGHGPHPSAPACPGQRPGGQGGRAGRRQGRPGP